MQNKKLIFTAVLGLLVICGCGIKGPPLPPIETIEAETINATATQAQSASATTQAVPASGDKTKTKK